MEAQSLIVYSLVGIAALYAVRHFIRQLTHGDAAGAKCSKCELMKAVTRKPPPSRPG